MIYIIIVMWGSHSTILVRIYLEPSYTFSQGILVERQIISAVNEIQNLFSKPLMSSLKSIILQILHLLFPISEANMLNYSNGLAKTEIPIGIINMPLNPLRTSTRFKFRSSGATGPFFIGNASKSSLTESIIYNLNI